MELFASFGKLKAPTSAIEIREKHKWDERMT
jgi:hypothetical protein